MVKMWPSFPQKRAFNATDPDERYKHLLLHVPQDCVLRKPRTRSEGLQIDFNSLDSPRWDHGKCRNSEMFFFNETTE